ARLNMLIDLGQELASEHDPLRVLENFCRSAREIVEAQEAAVGVLDSAALRERSPAAAASDAEGLRYFFRCAQNGDNVFGHGIPSVTQRALEVLVNKRSPLRLSDTDE